VRRLKDIASRIDWTAVAVLAAFLVIASAPSFERVAFALR
jgi:hypothetical protein